MQAAALSIGSQKRDFFFFAQMPGKGRLLYRAQSCAQVARSQSGIICTCTAEPRDSFQPLRPNAGLICFLGPSHWPLIWLVGVHRVYSTHIGIQGPMIPTVDSALTACLLFMFTPMSSEPEASSPKPLALAEANKMATLNFLRV